MGNSETIKCFAGGYSSKQEPTRAKYSTIGGQLTIELDNAQILTFTSRHLVLDFHAKTKRPKTQSPSNTAQFQVGSNAELLYMFKKIIVKYSWDGTSTSRCSVLEDTSSSTSAHWHCFHIPHSSTCVHYKLDFHTVSTATSVNKKWHLHRQSPLAWHVPVHPGTPVHSSPSVQSLTVSRKWPTLL